MTVRAGQGRGALYLSGARPKPGFENPLLLSLREEFAEVEALFPLTSGLGSESFTSTQATGLRPFVGAGALDATVLPTPEELIASPQAARLRRGSDAIVEALSCHAVKERAAALWVALLLLITLPLRVVEMSLHGGWSLLGAGASRVRPSVGLAALRGLWKLQIPRDFVRFPLYVGYRLNGLLEKSLVSGRAACRSVEFLTVPLLNALDIDPKLTLNKALTHDEACSLALHELVAWNRVVYSTVLRRRPDRVVVGDPSVLPAALWLKKAAGTRIIYHPAVRFLGWVTADTRCHDYLERLERLAVLAVDEMVADTEALANEIAPLLARTPGMCVRGELARPLPAPRRDLCPEARGRRILLYAGPLEKGLGLERLLELSIFLRHCIVVLVGQGSCQALLEAHIQALGVEGRAFVYADEAATQSTRDWSQARFGLCLLESSHGLATFERDGVLAILEQSGVPALVFEGSSLPLNCSDRPGASVQFLAAGDDEFVVAQLHAALASAHTELEKSA